MVSPLVSEPQAQFRHSFDRLGELLIRDQIITREQLKEAKDREQNGAGFFPEIIMNIASMTPHDFGPYLEEATSFPFVDLTDMEIDRELAATLPESLVSEKQILPFREIGGTVLLAMADPLNLATLDIVRTKFTQRVEPYMALPNDINEAIKRAYDSRSKTDVLIDEIQSEADQQEAGASDDLLQQSEEAPIVRLVNSIISGAVVAGASDIHIEPQQGSIRVRYRIDGIMSEQMKLPASSLSACVSRLKVISGMDISERRRPQDGRFSTRSEQGGDYDVRISIMPTIHGEKACMRLLEKANSLAKMDRLGFFPEQQKTFERFVRRPHGIVLVTGPTGSGKSTTLYAALQSINDSTKNINTVEDPVEYKLAGINQMQVNHKIGVTFASGLRTLVRQDPDVILVGEIRDKETAETSIQAALTGHLVLSTLHTNDAPGALIRLQNMGVEPFLISSAVTGVLGQRLMRQLCPHCRELYEPKIDEAMAIGLDVSRGDVPVLARPVGCRRCGGRGTKGRTAAVEIMSMTESLRQLVLNGATGAELTLQAVSEGMTTMRQSALRKALNYQVSAAEILRVFSEDE